MEAYEKYIAHLNHNILPHINYEALQHSYETEDKAYAKTILYVLNRAAIRYYGSDTLECHGELDYAVLPGLIQSKDTGRICLALLGIDLDSSGEHCGTAFLTRYGVVSQGHIEEQEIRDFMKEMYSGGYDYAYTFTVDGDIHIENADIPPAIKDFLATYHASAAKTIAEMQQRKERDTPNEAQETEETEEDEEDLEP